MSHNGQATVLVVDDVPANLGVVCDALGAAGLRVLVAESGPRALELLRRGAIDLVLLDVVMPGLDGFATYDLIRAEPAWAELPVIFLTALDTPAQKVRALESGAVDYVNKPVHPPELVARVRTHLALRTARRELQRRNAALSAEIALRIDAEEQLAVSLDRALLVVAGDGKIVFQTQLARHLLHKHSPAPGGDALLATWLDRQDRLRVRRFVEHNSGEFTVFFLEEDNPVAGLAALRGLGLTPREAEVMYWVAEGKANPEIAIILGAGRRTIATHVEHILEKLGVENRAAAVRIAADRLRGQTRPP